MREVYLVQWGLSDYEMPMFSVYLYAVDEEHAKSRAITEHEAEGEMIVDKITVY